MPWYRVGTVAITAGQTTVTGTGTNFSANGRVGDAFLGPDGHWYEVANIASGAVLSILPAYQGATVSGGTYALAPMQGYNKTLTDAVNGVVNQWGATLAGLGAVSTENVVPVAKGGTGGTTPANARSGLQLKSAAVADIVGSVSQSAGAPTGAIIERGSSANGEYTKYADGTLICTAVRRCDYAQTDLLLNSWTFPASFSGLPVISCTPLQGSAADISPATFRDIGASMAASVGSSTCSPRVWLTRGASAPFASGNFINLHCIAVGRWF